MSEKNIVESVLENLVQPSIESRMVIEDDGAFVKLPPGWRAESIESYRTRPSHVRQEVSFEDVSGFLAYVAEFKTEQTALFANPRCVSAVLDYHSKADPSWCSHRANYNLAHTVEWRAWADSQNRDMSQEDFAWFIEERLESIESPPAADLLGLIKQFKSTTTSKFVSVLNDNGATASLEFRKDANASAGGNEVEFPKTLSILLKPYDGIGGLNEDSHIYRFLVRLKYRVNQENNGVRFSYTIVGFERGKKAVFDELVAAITDALKIRTFVGGSLK